ncbi:MAG: hypothetical protein ABI569_13745 [Casimicrobiaceae bacterium]
MAKLAMGLRSVAVVALLVVGLPEALAATQRAFVASNGNDANAPLNCNLLNPCRSFGTAIGTVNPGGEVIVLDSAGYGPVTISQAVSIVAPPGVYAGVTVFSGPGIAVNAPGAKVTLRGLTINALGGTTGVQLQAAATLYLDGLIVTGFSGAGGAGIAAAVAANSVLVVNDCALRENLNGATFSASSGTLTVSVERTQFERNSTGAIFGDGVIGTVRESSFTVGGAGVAAVPVTAGRSAKVELRDSTISDNSGIGVQAGSVAGATATVSVVSSLVSGNGTGVFGQGSGNTVYVSDATLTRNVTGVSAVSSGAVVSFGDNRLMNNTSNGAFTSTIGKL